MCVCACVHVKNANDHHICVKKVIGIKLSNRFRVILNLAVNKNRQIFIKLFIDITMVFVCTGQSPVSIGILFSKLE